MAKKFIIGVAGFALSQLAHATIIVDGMYTGFNIAPSYIPPIKEFTLPAIAGLTNTVTYPRLTNNFGVTGDLHIGYKFNKRYLLEAAFGSSYHKMDTLKTDDITLPNSTWKLSGKIYTRYALFLNGIVQLGNYEQLDDEALIPFVGIGYGKASIRTEVKVSPKSGNGTTTINKSTYLAPVTQGIVGFHRYLDSYTFWGIDYRYQHYSKTKKFGKGYHAHNINLSLNFSLEDIF